MAFCSRAPAVAARSLISGLTLVVCLAAGSGAAWAQSGTVGSRPIKGGHEFVPSVFIPNAFVETRLSIGLGYSNTIETEIPLFVNGQQVGTAKGDLLFITGDIEFTCAMRDWIGFSVRLNGVARSGGNAASIFASGLSAGGGVGMGWQVRLMDTDRSTLSASVSIDPMTITLIDVSQFVANPNLGLTHTYNPLAESLTAAYAYGFNDLFGLSAFGSVGLGENPRDNYENGGFWKLGGTVSLNPAQRNGVPLGFVLGIRVTSYPESFDNTDGNSWAGFGSVSYMGRPDFTIRLDGIYEHVPIDYHDVALGYLGFTLGATYTF